MFILIKSIYVKLAFIVVLHFMHRNMNELYWMSGIDNYFHFISDSDSNSLSQKYRERLHTLLFLVVMTQMNMGLIVKKRCKRKWR
jgi:hypothetical protein